MTWAVPTATDAVGVTSFTTDHEPGAAFPLGTTEVTYTATDAAGHVTTASFDVVVTDGGAPEITVPSNMTVEATSAAGAVVTFTVSATDAGDGDGRLWQHVDEDVHGDRWSSVAYDFT
ncbi:MAG: HYR domain-containing protein [Hyphomicrobium sp.]|nr:HYR domain-containing protein [Hyphomicrobium sp.]